MFTTSGTYPWSFVTQILYCLSFFDLRHLIAPFGIFKHVLIIICNACIIINTDVDTSSLIVKWLNMTWLYHFNLNHLISCIQRTLGVKAGLVSPLQKGGSICCLRYIKCMQAGLKTGHNWAIPIFVGWKENRTVVDTSFRWISHQEFKTNSQTNDH